MSTRGRNSDASVAARRRDVLERVLARGEMDIRSLAQEHGVSVMTAYRDVDALVRDQLLVKDRGVVSAPPKLLVQTSAAFRIRAALEVKKAVATAALQLLTDVESLFIDDSTSCLPLLEQLAQSRTLPRTVITNYLRVPQLLASAPHITVHVLGGRYVPELDAVFGAVTEEQIGHWHADVAVFSNPAVEKGRLYHMLADSARIKRAMMGASASRILLLDSTKLGRTASHVVGDISEVDTVVIDRAASKDQIDAMLARGGHVLMADDPVCESAQEDVG